MKEKISIKKIIIVSLIFVFLTLITGVTYYLSTPYKPSQTFEQFKISEKDVQIDDRGNYYEITPQVEDILDDTAIIFYPGGHVAPLSYIPNMAEIARQSKVKVYITKPLFDFAILNSDMGNQVIKEHKEITHWFFAGHSLGGVAASMFIANHSEIKEIRGMIFLASYPADDKLKNRDDLIILSLYGSKDAFVSQTKIDESKKNLSNQAYFRKIEGMNHSQFGSYGLQNGDNQADLTNEDSRKKVAREIMVFLFPKQSDVA